MSRPITKFVLLLAIALILIAMTAAGPGAASGFQPTLTFIYPPTETPKLPTVDFLPTIAPYLPYEPSPAPVNEVNTGFWQWLVDLLHRLEIFLAGYAVN